MEGELWKGLYRIVTEVGKSYRSPAVQFSNTLIVLVFLWAVLHDRPISWACRLENWPAAEHWRALPSPATMSRRLRRLRVLTLLAAVENALRAQLPQRWVKSLDAKPLVVGGFSKDRDAARGWATSSKARGYKLFALCSGQEGLDAWTLGPMNQSEVVTAVELLAGVDGGGYLLGDSLYDSQPLHQAAQARGWQLVAPRKKPHLGVGRRAQSPARLRALELLDKPFGKSLYSARTSIERYFGHLGNFGGGLAPLPNWVRRPHRVALWVQGKILINAVRLTHGAILAA